MFTPTSTILFSSLPKTNFKTPGWTHSVDAAEGGQANGASSAVEENPGGAPGHSWTAPAPCWESPGSPGPGASIRLSTPAQAKAKQHWQPHASTGYRCRSSFVEAPGQPER